MTASVPRPTSLIKDIDLFQGLDSNATVSVLAAAVRSASKADAYVFFESDPADKIYVLLEGRVRLLQNTTEGQQVILHVVSAGEAFGVVALLSGIPYPVSAQVVSDSTFLTWGHSTITALMLSNPQIALNALRILANRVRDFQDRIRELATERVERRIARTLLRLARQTGHKIEEGVLIDMPITRQDLAEMTGTTLSTVSRTLSQWESMGLIHSTRERVVIRYPHGLVSIAEDFPPRFGNGPPGPS